MIGNLQLGNVVEIGPNRGHNLQAIADLDCVTGQIVGVEPNVKAAGIAQASFPRATLVQGNVFALPYADRCADLVFTVGVLIHVALTNLPQALDEIYRVSRRYILCIEYFAEIETVIYYRGSNNMLWKRDFKQHFFDRYPQLRMIDSGYWDKAQGFDRSHWWLFENIE